MSISLQSVFLLAISLCEESKNFQRYIFLWLKMKQHCIAVLHAEHFVPANPGKINRFADEVFLFLGGNGA